jgi:hypothetical protein
MPWKLPAPEVGTAEQAAPNGLADMSVAAALLLAADVGAAAVSAFVLDEHAATLRGMSRTLASTPALADLGRFDIRSPW